MGYQINRGTGSREYFGLGNGKLIVSDGTVRATLIFQDSSSVSCHFYVIDGSPFDIVLGYEFIKMQRILDTRSNVAEWLGQEIVNFIRFL